jgi:hypothetical protein
MRGDARRLETAARDQQRRLDRHDVLDAAPAAGSTTRRHDVQAQAKRTRAHAAATRARRRQEAGRSA